MIEQKLGPASFDGQFYSRKRMLDNGIGFVVLDMQPQDSKGKPPILLAAGPSTSLGGSEFVLRELYNLSGRRVFALSYDFDDTGGPRPLFLPDGSYQNGIRVLISHFKLDKVDIIVCPKAATDVTKVVAEGCGRRIYFVPPKDKYNIFQNSEVIQQAIKELEMSKVV